MTDTSNCPGCPECNDFEDEVAEIDTAVEMGDMTDDEAAERYRALGIG